MYTYKTEILTVGTKWLSDKADANDIAMLDNLINERAADGWELVTYDYMATSMQIKHLLLHSEKKKMIRRGMDWDKTLTFTVPMHGEARYRFDYLTSTYDSKDGKVEKFTF